MTNRDDVLFGVAAIRPTFVGDRSTFVEYFPLTEIAREQLRTQDVFPHRCAGEGCRICWWVRTRGER